MKLEAITDFVLFAALALAAYDVTAQPVFRGFDYGRWDYWASISDAGWGTWCTLTGWIQSWIVSTQLQILGKQSFWELTRQSSIGRTASSVIESMMTDPTIIPGSDTINKNTNTRVRATY